MTKAELVSEIADKAGLNRAKAKEALDAFIASVSTSLKEGREVRLVGFGSFVPVTRAAGVARNPKTGEEIPITARRVVTFHASQKLKSEVEEFYRGTQS